MKVIIGVIPASPEQVGTGSAHRESFWKDSRQAGMTEIWNCGRDHRV
ncbi:MAG: hypothetical protein HY808_14245 [Nitrospirae bacterium]|nr:hypothetical protein [Nitrospirota bacterium]